ncbi:helicase DnaB [Weissella bombi]|uniref:Replicative DNA helicase loader DnaB n=1 Tax=Weissella bombi TaxID=1505725 RepID=A0A1C3YV66_9LACO|nr:helicase DnaB [Weissella bombi]SCB73959.1 replicative DNA helicase loader DnaB [Weissella bombi]
MADFSNQQRYRLVYDELIDMTSVRSLTKVYLPIIGRDAYTLYLAWATMGETPEHKYRHVDILDQLAMNQNSFLIARNKLEAMGLVKTFKQTTTFGTQWVYQIFPPMTTHAFLSDVLLSSLLAHYLGDELFNDLVSDEKREAHIPGEDVSKTFFDLVGQESFIKRNHAPLSETDEKSTLPMNIRKATKSLDINLIADMLQSYNIKPNVLQKNEVDLMVYKTLYGLSDLELVRVIQATTTPNQQINLPAIKQRLSDNFKQSQVPQVKIDNNKTDNQAQKPTTNSTSDPASKIIQIAQTTSPLVFLKNLRQANNGFVADNEVKALADIAEMRRVTPEVLNIILYELTVVEKRTTINKTILQTLVNDWSQHKVTDAVSALQYLQKRHQKQQSQTTQRPNRKWSNTNKAPKQETRPDWENQHGTSVSQEDAKSARSALDAIRARRGQNNPKEK